MKLAGRKGKRHLSHYGVRRNLAKTPGEQNSDRLLEWKVSEDRILGIAKDLEFQANEG